MTKKAGRPPLNKRWGPEQNNECMKQFNLFVESGGSEGIDPDNVVDADYIIKKCIANDKLKRFLSSNHGGHKLNRDNQKAIRGVKRAASEFWVILGKQGIRRSTFVVQPPSRFPLLLLTFFACYSFPVSIENYLEDKGLKGA